MANIADDDSLVRRRSKRSTAGNRMDAALAEMAALQPEPEVDADDDRDFLGPADEDEIFDSDFQSTEEEDAQDDEAAGDREIFAEERQARKSARQRTIKAVEAHITASSAMPKTVATNEASMRPKRKKGNQLRRVSMGGAVDLETGEVVSKRKSRRQSTMISSQMLTSRLRDAEERRATMPKRAREVSATYTQAELLARALDTEEENIVSHRNYLEDEEEKRKRARVVKRKLTGPVLSWLSRSEDEEVPVEPSALALSSFVRTGSASQPSASASMYAGTSTGYSTYQPYGVSPSPASYFAPSMALQAHPQPQPDSPPTNIEKVGKTYLVYKVDEDMPKPDWGQTMTTIFGSHVDWEEVKVYSGKHRPLSRPVNKCPITGRSAIYRDPRSGVPYANVDAFKVLSRILTHEFVWNEELRCYTADEKAAQLEPDTSTLEEAGAGTPAPPTT